MSSRHTARRRPAPRPVWYRRRGVQIAGGVVAVLALIGALGDDEEQRPDTRPRPAVTVTETTTPSPSATPTPSPTPSTTPPAVEDDVDATLDVDPDVDRPRKCADKWWC